MKKIITIAATAAFAASAGAADFGQKVEQLLRAQSSSLFGFIQPAPAFTTTVARAPGQSATDLITLAPGLTASILTRKAASDADMFTLWPNAAAPTHAIFCIEGGAANIGPVGTTLPGGLVVKKNPAVQRIDLSNGNVETILRGMDRCDGIRTTAWGTILATEETNNGGGYEILEPLTTTNHTVLNRGATGIIGAGNVTPATIVDINNVPSTKVTKHVALPAMAWEGLDITATGVVYGGDERRPGSGYGGANVADSDGGALFKFIPTTPWAGGTLTDLALSPFAAGTTYAYRGLCSAGQWGQGCEIGRGQWVAVDPTFAPLDANAKQATGYYRPEDGHFDPKYTGPGVRFCWTNTGNTGFSNYGEVVCLDDPTPASGASVPVANRFVEGDPDFNAHDNLEFHPTTGNIYVIEDYSNGDIFACLRDGLDRDIKSDGCVRLLTVKDQSAEPTGFAFSGDGKTAYVSIQHSSDTACTVGTDCQNEDDYATDDIVKITGWTK
jgi:hypothetical protein